MSKKIILWIIGIVIVVGGIGTYSLMKHQQNTAWESKALTNDGKYKTADFEDVKNAAKDNNVIVLFSHEKDGKVPSETIKSFTTMQKKYSKFHPVVLVSNGEKPSKFGFSTNLDFPFLGKVAGGSGDKDEMFIVSISKTDDLPKGFGIYTDDNGSDFDKNSNGEVFKSNSDISHSLDNDFYNVYSVSYRFSYKAHENN